MKSLSDQIKNRLFCFSFSISCGVAMVDGVRLTEVDLSKKYPECCPGVGKWTWNDINFSVFFIQNKVVWITLMWR